MSQDSTTRDLMKRFDASLKVESPVWKAPSEVVARVPSPSDSIVYGWLNGRWPILATLLMTYLLINRWSPTDFNTMIGLVLIPMAAFLVWPLVPDAPSRYPWAFMVPCLLASALFVGLESVAQWQLSLLPARDPMFFCGVLQEHLERFTEPWRLALIGFTCCGGTLLIRRLARSHPWIDRAPRRSPARRWLMALPLALTLGSVAAPAALLAWNLQSSWTASIKADPDYEFVATGRLPASSLYASLTEVCQAPQDRDELRSFVQNASPEQVDGLAVALTTLLEEPTDQPGLIPLAYLVLQRASEQNVSTMSTVRLLMSYDRVIYGKSLHWSHSDALDEHRILYPCLVTEKMTAAQLKTLLDGLPRPRPADRGELRRYFDLAAVSKMSQLQPGETDPAYKELYQTPPGPLRLFGRNITPLSLPDLWCALERRVALERFHQWRTLETRNLGGLSQPLAWERYLPIWNRNVNQIERLGQLTDILEPGHGVDGYSIAARVLDIRLEKERTGMYPAEGIPPTYVGAGRYRAGKEYSYRSLGKAAVFHVGDREWIAR